jgi:hypothetical protein
MKFAAPIAALLLTACSESAPPAVPEHDPALAAALAEPIMVDTDLAGQNRANSAAAMPSQDGSVPTVDDGPEAIAAAQAEALALVGGPGKMREAPEPGELDAPLAAPALTAAERAAAVEGVRESCTGRLEATAMWAAKLPAAFPVYPRGAVQDASGTDAAGCKLRVIYFITPVPLDDVVDFYYTRARAAGFAAKHLRREQDTLLSGIGRGGAFDIYLSRRASGSTAVHMVTSGA